MDNKWDWTALRRKAAQWFQGKRASQLLVAAGLGGMLLIGLSQVMPPGREEPAPQPASQEAQTQDYARQLEQRLDSLVESIEGAGEARVMVTLENGYQRVYARSEKVDSDVLEDIRSGEERKTQEKQVTEQTYVLIDGSGGEEPLVTAELEPRVKGVVVVCEGGDRPEVVGKVVDAVTVALDISSARVSVSRLTAG